MEIHFAPLQGYADHIYRRLHAKLYGGIDCYYTPFIRIEKGEPRRQDITHLKDSIESGERTVPQIIFKSFDEFERLTLCIKALGCDRIDLNLGCPYPMQTRKGRGAAMIADTETMGRVTDFINSCSDIVFSVKTRLGLENESDLRNLMPMLNNTRLAHITVYPCSAREMYSGKLNIDEFNNILPVSKNPVIWNGEILTTDDINHIANNYTGIKGIMIGRGMLARPSLAAEWCEGNEWGQAKRIDTLLSFHDALLAEYEDTLCGQTQILQKIKPFWQYMSDAIDRKTFKAIQKATSLPRYREAVANI